MDNWLGHEMVFGRTGSGKSWWAWSQLHKYGRGVYIDVEGGQVPAGVGAVPASRRDEVDVILQVARQSRGVIHYVTHTDPVVARSEIALLVREALKRDWPAGAVWVIDEAHLFAAEGLVRGPVHELARRGRKRGLSLVAVTPRPQDIAKAVVSQAARVTVFPVAWSGPYLDRYGIPHDQVQAVLSDQPLYAPVQWVDGQVVPKAPARFS